MYKKLENLNFLHSLDLQQFPFFKGSRLHVCVTFYIYIYNFRYFLLKDRYILYLSTTYYPPIR